MATFETEPGRLFIGGGARGRLPPRSSPRSRGSALSEEEGDRFAAKTGFDPRRLSTPYLYFHVLPTRVQA